MEHQAVYDRLVRAARAQEFVHYGELAKMLGIDMDNPHFGAQVGKVLGRISEDEVAAGKPMISAIVVSRDDMLPGKGFYNLGKQLHQVQPDEEEIAFAIRQIRRVHDYWTSTSEAPAQSLDELVRRAREAAPNDRIEMRDEIAAYGKAAIDAMAEWLADSVLRHFAVRVIGRAGDLGARTEAVHALQDVAREADKPLCDDIEIELRRLGVRLVPGQRGPTVVDPTSVRDRLVTAARQHERVTYKEVAKAIGRPIKGPHWAVPIGRVLAPISEDEVAAGRPMLSAIVVSQDSDLPGEGFYKLGKQLGVVNAGETSEDFAKRQIRQVYEYWGGASSR